MEAGTRVQMVAPPTATHPEAWNTPLGTVMATHCVTSFVRWDTGATTAVDSDWLRRAVTA